MLIQSDFKPAWWLPNPHLQTMWPYFMRKLPEITLWRQRLDLPDGDFVDLDWSFNHLHHEIDFSQTPLILILHGLGGNIESPYAKTIMQTLKNHQFPSVFMHFRGASGVPNRLPCTAHADKLEDIEFVVEYLHQQFNNLKLGIIAYSMGGGMLLKMLGTSAAASLVRCAVAVSVPFNVKDTCERVQKGISQLYQRMLVRKMKEQIALKFNDPSMPLSVEIMNRIKTCYDYDREITIPLNKLASMELYHQSSSCRPYLKTINTPTLIIHALDDPFMYPNSVPHPKELSTSIEFELTKHGGHVGFISGNVPGKPIYYLDERIPGFLRERIFRS